MLNYNLNAAREVIMPLDKLVSALSKAQKNKEEKYSSIWKFFPAAGNSFSQRVAMLGLSEKELTPSVTLAVSALLEKLDDISHELTRAQDNLQEMQQLVDVDCVAPVPNRRAFIRRLQWAIAMHERYEHPSAVLYFDLNNFKEINDTYGHAAGDIAIRHVSQILLANLRESDFLARIGGDEFAIIMYYASKTAAHERGAKIARNIEATPFQFNTTEITLSTAFGSSSVKKGDDAEKTLAAADDAMYENKKLQRLQVLPTSSSI